MKYILRCLILLLMFPLVSRAQLQKRPEVLHQKMMQAYEQAYSHYGVAMGERENPEDPAVKRIQTAIADILCLKGDVTGCLAASKEVKRVLSPYTSLLKEGENVIGAILADGWFNGNLGPLGNLHNYYGFARLLLFQLSIELDNGESTTIISDENWFYLYVR